jgi:pimeloyl-ACP methyl ester carboxylesterase
VLGTRPEVVQVPGPLGDYESWFFPGTRSTWVLLLHGNTPDRLDMAKLLPALQAEGYPVLLVSLRNDPGAPEDPSGMMRYGATEWMDLEAAVSYAVGQGSSGVVLFGPSMGGGVVMSFLEHSSSASDVRAVVLDSPMLDFGRTVDFQASQESLPILGLSVPRTLVATAKWLASVRFGVEWSDLDYLTSTDELGVPILVFHGTEDSDVPIATSHELARARPDLVTLDEVDGATHLTSWNAGPAAYERQLIGFLHVNAP